MEWSQIAHWGGMVHRKRKRSKEGYLLGILPGVRQDQPRFMTGWIWKGTVRLTFRGIATPSGLTTMVNVP